MIVIRTMSERDSSAVWELEKKCFSVPWSEESIRAMFSEKGYWNLTARDDGSLVGYIGMKAVLDEADITNVAVDPDRRRQGIGKMLLRGLLAKAGGFFWRSGYPTQRRGPSTSRRVSGPWTSERTITKNQKRMRTSWSGRTEKDRERKKTSNSY